MRGNATVINALVPLANMFGYVNKLRSMSQGRAQLHDAVRPLRAGAEPGGAGNSVEIRLNRDRLEQSDGES